MPAVCKEIVKSGTEHFESHNSEIVVLAEPVRLRQPDSILEGFIFPGLLLQK